ncbi:peptidoglycan-binding protein, partial [bacterium]
VPDVKVGLLDKMGITFKDVLQSDENIKRFVAFENGAKTNPQGYLKPDSKDVTATTDLQKKLKMVGYNISVNGQFGNATEQAVIKFKNSVGINDGYLTKNGSYAVSGTVTPQTWAVLNANVAAKMNPNGNVSGSTYVPPVTQSEMKWAKELQGKIANFGYRPSDQERVKYEGIYQRQRVGMQAQGGVFDPTKAAPPTEQEMAWAQDIAHKMKQFGYKPSGAEKTKYQEIYQRVQMGKAGSQAPAQQPVAAQPRPQQITQNDVDWAVNLMNKVKGGYQPTAAESQKYEKVYSAMQNGQGPQKKTEVAATQTTAPKANVAPTKKELEWASQLEAKVAQGFNPTAEQKAKYTEIFDKYKTKATESMAAGPKATTGKPSNAEMQWASNLEKRVNEQGYQPTQAEVDKLKNILVHHFQEIMFFMQILMVNWLAKVQLMLRQNQAVTISVT